MNGTKPQTQDQDPDLADLAKLPYELAKQFLDNKKDLLDANASTTEILNLSIQYDCIGDYKTAQELYTKYKEVIRASK